MRLRGLLLRWGLVFTLAIGLAGPAYADSTMRSTESGAAVKKLVEAGLIKGDGKGVTNIYLNKNATLLQAGLIYLRLKGLEQEALNYIAKEGSGYTDAGGKQNQAVIAYLRAHPHLALLGFGGSELEPQKQITGPQYASLLLKVLGYEAGIDYQANHALLFARQKGVTTLSDGGLINRDIVASTYQALNMTPKNETITGLKKWQMRMKKDAYVPDVTVKTKYGDVQGVQLTNSSSISWLGVPYAKPPIGDLRWKAPRNPDSWTGKLETVRYQQTCVQTVNGKITGSEDCLYLNIWRPNQASSKLPVLVFTHGGGNVGGSGSSFVGDKLATAANSVVITINYRLGAMGYFRHPALQTGNPSDDSGNYGLLDILQSLKWVQENIEQFGGDSENVTLAGQSAGARDVLAAVISPYGKGLFQKAVVLSGGMTTSDPKAGEEKAANALVKLVQTEGKAATAEEAQAWINKQSKTELSAYLRGIKPEAIAVYYTDPAIRMAPFPHLFRDGAIIPKKGFDQIASGDYNKVPMILGSEQTEFSAFAFGDPYFASAAIDGSIFKDNKKLKQYQAAVQFGSELYAGFNVERVAEELTMQKDQPAVYGYRFAWGTRDGIISSQLQTLFGATHGADLDFYTGHTTGLASYFGKSYYNDENLAGRQELAAAMTRYLKYFLYTGNPNSQQNVEWKPWHAGDGVERILRLDGEKDHAVIEMSDEYLTVSATKKRMKQELSQEDLDLLETKIFAGRFFVDIP
ncbi:carboxylesterase family protein [Paenibacillus prosopidis]|uniref:Para-nitrobenzyl esterase n=1 Tax=Paenibacillus prosopidis TaxID=630520 RepID=A0A368W9W1_9BACL|nr:carboxylesterase family protein [Paenibacillus prosopidis]RCW51866.1 para-nitrobenzyl esterase [Paenibacillus prosopidis]